MCSFQVQYCRGGKSSSKNVDLMMMTSVLDLMMMTSGLLKEFKNQQEETRSAVFLIAGTGTL